jgi:hypothetical protein
MLAKSSFPAIRTIGTDSSEADATASLELGGLEQTVDCLE